MAKFGERLYDRTNDVGDGNILLLSSGEGKGDKSKQFIDGEQRTYKITDPKTEEFEEGITGCFIIGRFIRMDRATVVKSSNNNTHVFFKAGVKWIQSAPIDAADAGSGTTTITGVTTPFVPPTASAPGMAGLIPSFPQLGVSQTPADFIIGLDGVVVAKSDLGGGATIYFPDDLVQRNALTPQTDDLAFVSILRVIQRWNGTAWVDEEFYGLTVSDFVPPTDVADGQAGLVPMFTSLGAGKDPANYRLLLDGGIEEIITEAHFNWHFVNENTDLPLVVAKQGDAAFIRHIGIGIPELRSYDGADWNHEFTFGSKGRALFSNGALNADTYLDEEPDFTPMFFGANGGTLNLGTVTGTFQLKAGSAAYVPSGTTINIADGDLYLAFKDGINKIVYQVNANEVLYGVGLPVIADDITGSVGTEPKAAHADHKHGLQSRRSGSETAVPVLTADHNKTTADFSDYKGKVIPLNYIIAGDFTLVDPATVVDFSDEDGFHLIKRGGQAITLKDHLGAVLQPLTDDTIVTVRQFNGSWRLVTPTVDSLPTNHYVANGAISDEDQIAILDAGALAMTLPASILDRRIAYVKTHGDPVTLTANGTEEFDSEDGLGGIVTSTDQTLDINKSLMFGTLIGKVSGWSNIQGNVTQTPTPAVDLNIGEWQASGNLASPQFAGDGSTKRFRVQMSGVSLGFVAATLGVTLHNVTDVNDQVVETRSVRSDAVNDTPIVSTEFQATLLAGKTYELRPSNAASLSDYSFYHAYAQGL